MVKIKFLGHSAFLIEGAGKSILIDPFLTGNPLATAKHEDLNPDLILITHGHGDHLGDAITIAQRTGAKMLGVFEAMNYCESKGVKNVHPAHLGGKIRMDFGWVKIVQALHSSTTPSGVYAGPPVGFIINIENRNIYHAGDTGIFGDMAFYGNYPGIDTALLPIGGNFTMDVEDAVEAVKMLRCRNVVPMHYDTFPLIKADPEEFKRNVESSTNARVHILKPGETLEV